MVQRFLLTVLVLSVSHLFGQDIPLYKKNQSHDFQETISAFQKLASQSPETCQLINVGASDYGHPIPLFIINKSGIFNKTEYNKKTVLLINNAIHPGEPCGVDASIELAQNYISKPNTIPENVIIAIIPMYNIGGAHNRNCCSRANQNGPEMYGFRGNAKNLDLNRDFIKADSKNTLAFYQIYHLLKPAIFIDTHTSNGADYQHTMTLITSQLNKMTPRLSEYTSSKLNPYLFEKMAQDDFEMVPYVHSINKTPDSGIKDYLETPRYSTGFTNVFNTISYVTEAHMLKPYEDRVVGTRTFLEHMINYMENNADELKDLKKSASEDNIKLTKLPLNWELDTTHWEKLSFNGFTAEQKQSKITNGKRLYYNREKPYTKTIRYYNKYIPIEHVSVPNYYIIPKAWSVIIELFLMNDIDVYTINEETLFTAESYYIDTYKTAKNPFEGHYLHYNISLSKAEKKIQFNPGDYVIPVKNEALRFIMETLEPNAPDSYFAWNYFDAILQQKEWFSSYVFEDEAYDMLQNDSELKEKFEQKKATDSTFAQDDFAQLYYLYKKSDHYERTKNQYPIVRVNETIPSQALTKITSIQ